MITLRILGLFGALALVEGLNIPNRRTEEPATNDLSIFQSIPSQANPTVVTTAVVESQVIKTAVFISDARVPTPISLPDPAPEKLDPSDEKVKSVISSIQEDISKALPLVTSWAESPDELKATAAVDALGLAIKDVGGLTNNLPNGEVTLEECQSASDSKQDLVSSLNALVCILEDILGSLQVGGDPSLHVSGVQSGVEGATSQISAIAAIVGASPATDPNSGPGCNPPEQPAHSGQSGQPAVAGQTDTECAQQADGTDCSGTGTCKADERGSCMGGKCECQPTYESPPTIPPAEDPSQQDPNTPSVDGPCHQDQQCVGTLPCNLGQAAACNLKTNKCECTSPPSPPPTPPDANSTCTAGDKCQPSEPCKEGLVGVCKEENMCECFVLPMPSPETGTQCSAEPDCTAMSQNCNSGQEGVCQEGKCVCSLIAPPPPPEASPECTPDSKCQPSPPCKDDEDATCKEGKCACEARKTNDPPETCTPEKECQPEQPCKEGEAGVCKDDKCACQPKEETNGRPGTVYIVTLGEGDHGSVSNDAAGLIPFSWVMLTPKDASQWNVCDEAHVAELATNAVSIQHLETLKELAVEGQDKDVFGRRGCKYTGPPGGDNTFGKLACDGQDEVQCVKDEWADDKNHSCDDGGHFEEWAPAVRCEFK